MNKWLQNTLTVYLLIIIVPQTPKPLFFLAMDGILRHDLGKELFELYPNKYYFNLWGNRIMSFNDRVWANDLLTQNSCVLFRGDGGFDFSDGPYDLRLMEKGPYREHSNFDINHRKTSGNIFIRITAVYSGRRLYQSLYVRASGQEASIISRTVH